MADSKRPHEYTPEELKESLSTFDPEAIGDQAPGDQPSPGAPDAASPTAPDKGGPIPGTTPKETRLAEKAAEFRGNIPERERDDRLPHASRGHSSKGD